MAICNFIITTNNNTKIIIEKLLFGLLFLGLYKSYWINFYLENLVNKIKSK